MEAKKVPKLFHHPTVGILSIPMTVTYHKNTHSYIPASYVKWIEMNNARVIPIPYDSPIGALDMILNQVNGVLFIGGQVDHGMIENGMWTTHVSKKVYAALKEKALTDLIS